MNASDIVRIVHGVRDHFITDVGRYGSIGVGYSCSVQWDPFSLEVTITVYRKPDGQTRYLLTTLTRVDDVVTDLMTATNNLITSLPALGA